MGGTDRMRGLRFALIAVAVVGFANVAPAQTRRAPARRPAPPPPTKAVPEMRCPTPLGEGVTTKQVFCDVMSSRNPAEGIIIKLPPHRGDVTLTFDLHNRHTYSEEQVKTNRAYARYTAVIGVLAMDNTLISRAVVQSEFRHAPDLVDRVSGGAGPGGVKAVAPSGTEHIAITVPEIENEVSVLGEKVTIERPEGTATYSSPGRPIAIISNVMIEYVEPPPPPPKRAPARRPGG